MTLEGKLNHLTKVVQQLPMSKDLVTVVRRSLTEPS